jgi:glutathione S-transferase
MSGATLADLWADPAVPLVLRSTETSPFGRKVRMALLVLDLGGRVRLEPADTLSETDTLRVQNPLGKMPCLLIGAEAIFDSNVILELLDDLAGGGRLVPRGGMDRYRSLTRARLADGVTEAALLITYEGRFRDPAQHSERWLTHQRQKILRGLRDFERTPPDPARADLVALTLAACLGYLDWRQPLDWRAQFPGLAAWLAAFAAAQPAWSTTERTQ